MHIRIMPVADKYVVYGVRQGPMDIWKDNTLFISTDYDFPSTAEMFGMQLRHKSGCSKRETDGTTDCPECGKTVEQFIAQSRTYLDNCCEWNKGRYVPDIFGDC